MKKRKFAKLSTYSLEYLLSIYEETKKEILKYDISKLQKDYEFVITKEKEMLKDFKTLSGMDYYKFIESKLKPSKLQYLDSIKLLYRDIEKFKDDNDSVIINYQTLTYLYGKLAQFKKEIDKRMKKLSFKDTKEY